MRLIQHPIIQTLGLAGFAVLFLSGCESKNYEQLSANQAMGVTPTHCGDRAHGEFWFELTDQTSTNDTYVCPNGRIGSATHFLEAQFQCEQGQAIATGTTRLDPQPLSHNCDSLAVPPPTTRAPPPTPQVCTPGDKQSCSIANGAGQRTCNAAGSGWNNCQVFRCRPDFIQTGNRCVRNTFRGSGLFTCDASSHCQISCGGSGQLYRIERGQKGFCSSALPSNPAGTIKGTGAGDWGWIEAEFELHNGRFIKANTTRVEVKITCDVNSRGSRVMFGRNECFYEEKGITNSSTQRRSILRNQRADNGVRFSGQDLSLNHRHFYPFKKLKKNTSKEFRVRSIRRSYTAQWWTGQKTKRNRGNTVVELKATADMSWKATKY